MRKIGVLNDSTALEVYSIYLRLNHRVPQTSDLTQDHWWSSNLLDVYQISPQEHPEGPETLWNWKVENNSKAGIKAIGIKEKNQFREGKKGYKFKQGGGKPC